MTKGAMACVPGSTGQRTGTRALGAARSAEFLTRVRRRLESLGWPQLTATFVGYLTVARRT
jgi:hypothetical protein